MQGSEWFTGKLGVNANVQLIKTLWIIDYPQKALIYKICLRARYHDE